MWIDQQIRCNKKWGKLRLETWKRKIPEFVGTDLINIIYDLINITHCINFGNWKNDILSIVSKIDLMSGSFIFFYLSGLSTYISRILTFLAPFVYGQALWK